MNTPPRESAPAPTQCTPESSNNAHQTNAAPSARARTDSLLTINNKLGAPWWRGVREDALNSFWATSASCGAVWNASE